MNFGACLFHREAARAQDLTRLLCIGEMMSNEAISSTPKRASRANSMQSPVTTSNMRSNTSKRGSTILGSPNIEKGNSEVSESMDNFADIDDAELLDAELPDDVQGNASLIAENDPDLTDNFLIRANQVEHLSEENVEESDAPLEGQKTLLRLGFTHPKNMPDTCTGIRMELVILDSLKHIDLNGLKAFCNEKGRAFMHPECHFAIGGKNHRPVLVKEINGYPDKSGGTVIFGKISCIPDLNFLKMLFTAVADKSNLSFCAETFASEEKMHELCRPFLAAGKM